MFSTILDWCAQAGSPRRRCNSIQAGIQLRPDFADAFNNMGNVLADKLRLDDALAHFDNALRLKPVFPECRWNRATLLLLEGNFKEGWPAYESRWQQPGFTLPPYRQPRWDGSALGGKTILLWGEQGIGDTLPVCPLCAAGEAALWPCAGRMPTGIGAAAGDRGGSRRSGRQGRATTRF